MNVCVHKSVCCRETPNMYTCSVVVSIGNVCVQWQTRFIQCLLMGTWYITAAQWGLCIYSHLQWWIKDQAAAAASDPGGRMQTKVFLIDDQITAAHDSLEWQPNTDRRGIKGRVYLSVSDVSVVMWAVESRGNFHYFQIPSPWWGVGRNVLTSLKSQRGEKKCSSDFQTALAALSLRIVAITDICTDHSTVGTAPTPSASGSIQLCLIFMTPKGLKTHMFYMLGVTKTAPLWRKINEDYRSWWIDTCLGRRCAPVGCWMMLWVHVRRTNAEIGFNNS